MSSLTHTKCRKVEKRPSDLVWGRTSGKVQMFLQVGILIEFLIALIYSFIHRNWDSKKSSLINDPADMLTYSVPSRVEWARLHTATRRSRAIDTSPSSVSETEPWHLLKCRILVAGIQHGLEKLLEDCLHNQFWKASRVRILPFKQIIDSRIWTVQQRRLVNTSNHVS